MRFATGVTVVAALLSGAALAAPARDELIRPGVGIAGARLGMTSAQLRTEMGKPQAVISTRLGFGRRHLEWQYGFASYIVRLQGTPGRERVVAVTTVLRKEKTRAGIGVGSLESALLRAHAGVRCEPHRRDTGFAPGHVFMGGRRTCTIGSEQAAQTVFVIDGPRMLVDDAGVSAFEERWRREAEVLFVSVRAAGYRPPPS